MDEDYEGELSIVYGHRFGQAALNMGFVNINQVQNALAEQMEFHVCTRLRPLKLIGEILYEHGWITLDQIERVLNEIS